MTEDNRFASIDEITVDAEVWAEARAWWRRARVMEKARRVVLVGFRLRHGAIRLQAVSLGRLRRARPSSRFVIDDRPPSLAEIRATREISE